MRQTKIAKTYQDQHGVVSIIVVSILTVTLALIAVGFSELADRELRQASDRESSAQAFYAAQSGINDALAYISAGGTSFPGCAPSFSGTGPNPDQYFTSDLSGGSNIAKYSCISIDNTPKVLSGTVTPGQPWIVKVSAASLSNLYIGWENNSYDNTKPFNWLSASPAPKLPVEDNLPPNTTGVLRTGLYAVPVSDSSDTNDNLSTSSRAYYLFPNSGNGSATAAAYGSGTYNINGGGPGGNNGNFILGNCKNSNPKPDPSGNNLGDRTYCNMKITGLTGTGSFDASGNPTTGNYYYLYLMAQYNPLSVVIQGTDSGGAPVKFADSQAVIDVTGQGSGQIQRVRARVGLTSQFNQPSYSVLSMETLCKAFVEQILPGNTYQTAVGPAAGNDPSACRANLGTGSILDGGRAGH